jgi:Glycosyltransferase family 87
MVEHPIERASTDSGLRRAKATAFKLRMGMGVLLILAGIGVNRWAFNSLGVDFAPQYMSAWVLREGKNVYDFQVQHDGYIRHVGEVTTWAHFHPPAAAVVALPATLVSYPTARELWFVAATIVMLVGLWRFMAVFVPRWDQSERTLVLGLVMCAAATRWGFKVAQPGAIVLGLFGLFLAELRSERSWTAFLCGGLVASMKVTFGLPFFLMALAHKRFKLTTAMLGLVASLNIIGLYGMGGPLILSDYRANFAQFERADQPNYPDPRGFNSMARTDWPYLLNAFSPSFERNNLLGYGLTLVAFAWLAMSVFPARKHLREDIPTLALTGPFVAISLLAVYHHHYDMGLLLLPLIAYLGRKEIRSVPASWFLIVPVGLYAGLYPYDKSAKLVERLFGANSVLLTRPLACAVCIVAFTGSVVLVRSVVGVVGRLTEPDESLPLKHAPAVQIP